MIKQERVLQDLWDVTDKLVANLLELRAENANLATGLQELTAENVRLKQENASLLDSLPHHSGADANKAYRVLGTIYRHRIGDGGDYPEIGVVDVNLAREALIRAYAETNALFDRVRKQAAENQCDVCLGDSSPATTVVPCMCGGTGLMSRAAQHLRERLHESETLTETLERELADIRRFSEDKIRKVLENG